MNEKEQFQRIVKIKPDEIVHGPGRRDMDWHDTLQSVATRLEAFADEFERLARNPQQKDLTDKFAAFVGEIVRERLSMESLGELGSELEKFEYLDEIDVGLAGALEQLGEQAGEAWEQWMEGDNVQEPQWQFWIEPKRWVGSEGAFLQADEKDANTWFVFGKNGGEQRVFGLFENRQGAEKGMEYWDTHREEISPTMRELSQDRKQGLKM